MNDMFTLDFSKKIIICANSEEELNKQYSEIAQARIEPKQQFIECKIYIAVLVPVSKEKLLKSYKGSKLFRFGMNRDSDF